MLAIDKAQSDQNNYFTCAICLKVVHEPKECQTCNNLFCGSCILQWEGKDPQDAQDVIVGSKVCPFHCKQPKYGNIHRFSKNELLSKKFKCPNIELGCAAHLQNGAQDNEYVFTYPEALTHKMECQFREVPCRHKCGLNVKLFDLDKHMGECPAREVLCEQCELSFKFIESNSHNCLQALKEKLKQKEQDMADLGFGNLEKKPICKCGKEYKIEFGNPYHRGNVLCDSCKLSGMKTLLDGHQFYWHCHSC